MIEKDLNEEVCKYLATLKRNYSYNFKTFKPDLFKYIFDYTKFMDENSPSFRGRLTAVVNNLQQYPVCQLQSCNKILDINDWKPLKQLPKHCCRKHSALDKNTKDQRAKTCLEKYGETSVLKLSSTKNAANDRLKKHKSSIVEKRKKTSLERYGVEHYVNLEKAKQTKFEKYNNANYNNCEKAKQTNSLKTKQTINLEKEKRIATYNKHKTEDPNFAKNMQEKSVATRKKNNGEDYTGRAKCKQTVLQKYGVENIFQSDITKEKSKCTLKENYGVEHPLQNKELLAKAKDAQEKTCLEKYGCKNFSQSEEAKKQCLEKYGVEHYFQSEDIKEKSRKTCLEKYGAQYVLQLDEFKEKYKQTCLETYGTEHPLQSEDIKEKLIKTFLERFNTVNPMQIRDIRIKGQQRYEFNGIKFDSSPELAFYIWLTDNKIKFEYQPDKVFVYEFNGKKHVCLTDFLVDGQYIELKGKQFLKEDSSWQNPYDHSLDELYEAKHQCLLKNNVRIIYSDEYSTYLDYVSEKYGKDYLKNFRKSK